jgi:REP element-mobilizing transposase RayT
MDPSRRLVLDPSDIDLMAPPTRSDAYPADRSLSSGDANGSSQPHARWKQCSIKMRGGPAHRRSGRSTGPIASWERSLELDWALFSQPAGATTQPSAEAADKLFVRCRRPRQLDLPALGGWGGRRAGAGRKLRAARPSPPHRPRARHQARWPVHVTLRARDTVPTLRSSRVFPILRRALSASLKSAFRVVHFSVQSNHVHLLVEGDDALALVRGLQGLAGRCAKAINRASGRCGRVWSSRYHSHHLRTPTEARRGLVYVLLNFRKHLRAAPAVDPRSSGPWFNGWRRPALPSKSAPREPTPVASPRTWLATVGWRRAGGAIALHEQPAALRSPRR